MTETLATIEFRVENTHELTGSDRALIGDLFEKNYRQANRQYLDNSLKTLQRISMAQADGRLVGFSLAGSASVAIPRMSQKQWVMMGGIGCIDPNYRRIGLFSQLATMAGGERESVLHGVERVLACARIAHPASFRTLSRLPSVIPKHDKPLTAWHLEIAAVIAELYGVTLKPQSLVVQGEGSAIGYPNINPDVSDDEWLPFGDVNRDQGDSLLGIAWAPDAPEGW